SGLFVIGEEAWKVYNAFIRVQNSDAQFTDASYLRLKNVMLSYQFPEPLVKKIGVQGLRIYTQAQNLLTLSGYEGYDPETRGLTLPPLQMTTIGLQVTF